MMHASIEDAFGEGCGLRGARLRTQTDFTHDVVMRNLCVPLCRSMGADVLGAVRAIVDARFDAIRSAPRVDDARRMLLDVLNDNLVPGFLTKEARTWFIVRSEYGGIGREYEAATTIQAHFRGWRVRHEYRYDPGNRLGCHVAMRMMMSTDDV